MQNAKYALPGIRVSFTEVTFLAVFCCTQRNYGNEGTMNSDVFNGQSVRDISRRHYPTLFHKLMIINFLRQL